MNCVFIKLLLCLKTKYKKIEQQQQQKVNLTKNSYKTRVPEQNFLNPKSKSINNNRKTIG